MQKLLKYSVIILVLVAIADFFVGKTGDYLVKNLPDYGDNLIVKPYYALQKAQGNILILGSSRAEHHYDTRILQKKFPNHTIYNAGQHNQGMNYALCVLQSCLEKKIPELVILDCEPEVLGDELTSSISTLKLYYNENKNVKNHLSRTFKDKMLMKSGFYIYNSVIIKLFLDSRLPYTQDTLMGFAPLQGILDTALTKYNEKTFPSLLDGAINDFNDIISLSKKYGFKLCVCISPYYYHQNENALPYIAVKNICNKTKIPCFDYMNDGYFDSNPQLFRDVNHLNEKGAAIFTEKFSDNI